MYMFHNRSRHLNHIKYRSAICKYTMLLAGPMVEDEIADQLDATEADRCRLLAHKCRRRHYAESAAFRLPGPLNKCLLRNEYHFSKHHVLGKG